MEPRLSSSTHGADAAFSTQTIHGGQRVCPSTGAVFPPLYTSSTCAVWHVWALNVYV